MEHTSKWLSTLSGHLKPQVRLGLAISEFAQALDEDRKHDFRRMQDASNNQLSGADVIKVTEQINKDGERRHSAWRPYGTRVHSFLSRLQMFASIGDLMIGGSQNLIATGVWSAVRLSLTAATNLLGYFEKLSTLFMKLGTSWTLHKDYAELFTSSEVLQNHLCEYLIVLMRLCRKVVLFTQKSPTSQLFSSLGSSFDAEFGPIQKEMEERGSLIQQTAHHLAAKSFLGSHLDSQKSRLRDFRCRTLQKLSPGQAQYVTTWKRQRRKGTCNWVREMQDYKAWRASQNSSTICINGKLGSGKTVAMANIVAEINIEQPCAFFFCTFKEPETLKASNILGSIAFHLLNGLPDKDIPWDALAGQDDALSGIWSPDDIVDIILRLAPRSKRHAILIDGLEDCLDEDIDDVVLGLQRLVENRTILLCYSVRSESLFDRRARGSLPADFCISLDEGKHDEEIHAYITKEIRRRNASGYLSSELEDLVKKQLIVGSQGMYLWVSLQLNTIFPSDTQTVTTDEQILGLIENLPKDLPEAFERALENNTDKRYDGRMMRLILAAVTPLTLDELRVALTITPGEPIWRPSCIPHDGSQLISLCGGNLLELDEEDNRVRFIHHSVIQHLLSPAMSPYTYPYHFSDRDAEQYIGSVCVTYLNLPFFDHRLSVTRKIRGDELTGKIGASTRQESGTALVRRLAHHFKSRERTHPSSAPFDIGRLASEIQAMRLKDRLDPVCFKDYAVHNWLLHTRFFKKEDKLCDGSWSLWWQLLCGATMITSIPFPNPTEDPIPALRWAIAHGNGAVFLNVLVSPEVHIDDFAQLSRITRDLRLQGSIQGEWLGDLLAQITKLFPTYKISTTEVTGWIKNIIGLCALGAHPTMPHHKAKTTPVENFIRAMIHPTDYGVGISEVLGILLSDQAARDLLQLEFVPIALRELIRLGRRPVLNQILAFHPNLQIEPPGDSLIGMAVKYGYTAIVEDLLAAGASATSSLIQGRPAIQVALEKRRKVMVILLGQYGATNILTSDGTSLLWMAIQQMSDGWASLLLELGANPNAGPFLDTDGGSENIACQLYPLQAALERNRTRLCMELVAHGAEICPPSGPNPLDIAMRKGNDLLATILRDLGEKVSREKHKNPCDVQGPTALFSILRMLVAYYAGVQDRYGNNDIELKFSWGEKLIRLLAHSSKAESLNFQDGHGDTALHYLASLGSTLSLDYVQLLLELGADPNIANHSGLTPLALAFYHDAGFDTTIYPLLRSGASLSDVSVQDPDVQDGDGNTALHYLATIPSAGTGIELLLHKGANPNSRNHQGETPVHAAAEAGEVATANLKILLDRGGDPNSKTIMTGENPLYFAILRYKATKESVRILLEAGADSNDAPGTYPRISLLQRAITPSRDGYVTSEVIQLLLQAGADPLVPVSTGGTLEDLALQRGEEAVASLLSRVFRKQRIDSVSV
ncbi:hypothetical protein VP1G_01639 [Cytospora mali]|uniref:Nephrocystin 3-like N-terminal domain-containing protein n=1 Tax=Cytospora mali TaxID=578113 RepID=A0A194UR43_CYTMA|nr:hypothetical protein VP1G_01639 [Valsa mali var. pyri (nom. inval.)]